MSLNTPIGSYILTSPAIPTPSVETSVLLYRIIIIIKQVYRRRYESPRSSKPKLH